MESIFQYFRAVPPESNCCFGNHDVPEPIQTIELIPSKNKTFHFWHIFVEGLKAGAHYAFRVTGPAMPEAGLRYSHNKVLIDPYSRGNSKAVWRREDACNDSDDVATSLRSVVTDPFDYDWEGDTPLNTPIEDTIVYEMHCGDLPNLPHQRSSIRGSSRA
jgi:glycogen operon protein